MLTFRLSARRSTISPGKRPTRSSSDLRGLAEANSPCIPHLRQGAKNAIPPSPKWALDDRQFLLRGKWRKICDLSMGVGIGHPLDWTMGGG